MEKRDISKMNRESKIYPFLFAGMICLICSFVLAFISESLKSKTMINEDVHMKQNIFKAVGFKEKELLSMKSEKFLSFYKNRIRKFYVNEQGKLVSSCEKEDESCNTKELYYYKNREGHAAYCIPFSGKGLWSTIYGYLALEEDCITVRGITFYQHGETPGLGGEIDQGWFRNNFKGKKIWNLENNHLTSVRVVKGKVKDVIKDQERSQHYVDGISGATLTSNGISKMLKDTLTKYELFLKKRIMNKERIRFRDKQ